MPVEFYPDQHTAKKAKHVIEQLQTPNILYNIEGSYDLSSGALAVEVWSPGSWEIRRIGLHFEGANEKDYSLSVIRGRGIVTGKNDRLYFKIPGFAQEPIILSQGFYNGTELAAELQTQLNAATNLAAAQPFAVSYAAATGLFTVTPTASTVAYFHVNQTVPMRRRSTGGRLLGFTQDVAEGASIQSTSAVFGLGQGFVYQSAAGSDLTNIMGTDTLAMTLDNALSITVTSAPTTVHYEVVYREVS